jgi:5-formyltetrahydrofolate cyclo-ligase
VLSAVNAPSQDVPVGAKSALRAEILTRRESLPVETRAQASGVIADIIDRQVLAGLVPGSFVALYAPKGSEVDTAAIEDHARERDLVVAYPRVARPSRVLSFFRAWARDLVPGGAFALREPRPDASLVPVADLSAIIVPGIAFDASGQRIGWGQGYYDATLSSIRSITSIGIAFATQIIPCVPATPSDVPVHLVITEDGIVRAT